MVDYNAMFNKGVGIIPITKYRDFYDRFGKFLKTTNQHAILSNHQVFCSNCSYNFKKESLMFFKTMGTKRLGDNRRVLSKDDVRVQRTLEGKCPKCGHTNIKIRIVKLQVEKLSGQHTIVFVCGETKSVTEAYKKAENKMVKWIKSSQGANLSPSANVYRFQFRALPTARNRKGVDRFVKGLQQKKRTGIRNHQVKSYNKDGYHFIVVYM